MNGLNQIFGALLAEIHIIWCLLFNEEYDFNLPANYSFTRKAAYQYGWDWGPRILTVGIWK